MLGRWRGKGLWQRLSERSARCTLGESTIGLDRFPVLCVFVDNCATFWGDGVAWCQGECAQWGGLVCHWTSSVADDLWCETGDPGGSLVSRQKGIPEWETSSAMRSGTGTLRFFYVACDHGRRDAQGRQWGESHLNGCLSRGEGGPARACRFRQAVSDRRSGRCRLCGSPLRGGGGPGPDRGGAPAGASATSAFVAASAAAL